MLESIILIPNDAYLHNLTILLCLQGFRFDWKFMINFEYLNFFVVFD